MSKYLITGVAGSGKSTIAVELKKRGYAAYDTEMGFSYHINKATGERAAYPSHPSLEWYDQHERVFDEKVLENLFKKHAGEPLFISSITANQKKYYPQFDKIFLLTADDDTIIKRIEERTDNHFGKHPLELQRVLSRKQAFDDELKAAGAEVIDSTKPVDEVIKEILGGHKMSDCATVLKHGTRHLEKAGIGTARLDVLVMLEDLLSRERGWLLAHPETRLASDQLEKLDKWLERRATHEPLAYIRGRTEFYGRDFVVNKDVLEPRPESETMIDLLKRQRLPFRQRIADVGSGSGALGITAALELPSAMVDLYELDEKALKVGEENVKKHSLDIRSFQSDLLSRRSAEYDVILANLPYVPSRYQINEAAGREPRIAIFGGGDGLEIYRRLFSQLATLPVKPRFILTEAMPPQHRELAAIAEGWGFKAQRPQDFIQVFETIY